jgi:nucleoside-diphosphate-sugar epimerase
MSSPSTNTPAGKTALVLGATGGIGGAVAAVLLSRGWTVRALVRDRQRIGAAGPHLAAACEWIEGDAMVAADVARAAEGAAIIVHAVNPPGYRNWQQLVMPMIDNTIAAAAATGARIVLPGTIYNFDAAATPVVSPTTPQNPTSIKGRVRKDLEARLAANAHRAPALIVRAGDFFGPEVRNSWFGQVMVTPGKPVARIVNPGKGVGHSWAYLPDLAEAIMRLIEQDERLAAFEVVPFEGTWDPSGSGMADAIRRVTGRPNLREWGFPWWTMRLAAPFGSFPRELVDIESVWRHPMRFDNTRLEQLIGPEPRTPLDTAIAATLAGLGCLGPDQRAERLSTARTSARHG